MCINLLNGIPTINEVPAKLKSPERQVNSCSILTMAQGTIIIFTVCIMTLLGYGNHCVFRNMNNNHPHVNDIEIRILCSVSVCRDDKPYINLAWPTIL